MSLNTIDIDIDFLFTDSLPKTTLDSPGCPAVYEKTLDRRLWANCPAWEAANCFESH